MKVFIADDDGFLRQMYRKELEAAGHTVVLAENGEKALKLLMHEHPDVIILDILMPGRDGFDVLETIKKDPVLGAIPVIILTNVHQKVEVERALALGAADFISKADVKVGDLAKIVERLAKA